MNRIQGAKVGGEPAHAFKRTESISDRRIARVIDYMKANYAKSPSIDELSREAGISKFHFVTVFRKKVGVPPHRYLIDLRLKKAAALLRTTKNSVGQIANACGYEYAAQFAAAFARRFDATPWNYRQSAVDN